MFSDFPLIPCGDSPKKCLFIKSDFLSSEATHTVVFFIPEKDPQGVFARPTYGPHYGSISIREQTCFVILLTVDLMNRQIE